jgi:uncharacterized membrane protein YhiD involved in acid resistance
MTINAELPNGTILEFPDGTKQNVIDSVVKKQILENPKFFIPKKRQSELNIEINEIDKRYYKANTKNTKNDIIEKNNTIKKLVNNNEKISLENTENTYIQNNNLNAKKNKEVADEFNQSQTIINTIQIPNNSLQHQINYSILFIIIFLVIFLIYYFKLHTKVIIRYEKLDKNRFVYNFILIFSIFMTITMFFTNSHNTGIGIIIWGYLTNLIYKKNYSKLVNLLSLLIKIGSMISLILIGIGIFTDLALLNYELPILITVLIYYFMVTFFKKQHDKNKDDNYNSKNNYTDNENFSQNKNNHYKKQNDYKSDYQSKYSDNKNYKKSGTSNSESNFDCRLNDIKSNIANCYELLDLNPKSTPSEIKIAFKKKMSSYHPDKVSGLGEKLLKVAEEETKLINVAYQTLKSHGKC